MSRCFFRSLLAASLIAPLLGVGCAPSNPRPSIEGTVTYQEKPVSNQTLKLYMAADKPEDSFSHPIRIQPDGTFKGDAPAPGSYKVVIERPLSALEGKPLAEVPIPPKYRDVSTTDLRWTIEKGQNKKDFVLVD